MRNALGSISIILLCCHSSEAQEILDWSELTPLTPPVVHLGLAGPFAGISNDALIVAGGANFPKPVWEASKQWHREIYVLVRYGNSHQWRTGYSLRRPLAYGAAVTTKHGVLCIGGNDAERTYADVFLLRWNPESKQVDQEPLPGLPARCAYASATMIGDTVYVAAGTTGTDLGTAQQNFWSLDLTTLDDEQLAWRRLEPWPGPARAFAIAATQHNGIEDCVYLISGRRLGEDGEVDFLTDVYEYAPGGENPWRRRADVPRCVMAGTGIALGKSRVLVLGGADGTLYHQADSLKDKHPGFPKEALSYDTITDTWSSTGPIPANHVTTTLVRWGADKENAPIIIPSGEVRPRVRSPKVWQVRPARASH